MSLIIIVVVFLVSATYLWIKHGMLQVELAYARYAKWNETQWRIDKIPKPNYVAQFINSCAFGSIFGTIMLFLIRKRLVEPSLENSLKLMKQADEEGAVPKILCNAQARRDMKERLDEFYKDIHETQTLTTVAKILNYAHSYGCLKAHHALLTLGMKTKVQEEVIENPVFIASLPRTGTTMLHKTLAKDTNRFRTFDLCDMLRPLPKPIPRWDKAGRKEKSEEMRRHMERMVSIYPGWLDCMETMHGLRPDEADEDLFWYDIGLGHSFMEPLVKMYPQYRSKPGGMAKVENREVARYRYAWLAMIMRIYQHVDKEEWEAGKQRQRMGSDTPSTASNETSPLATPSASETHRSTFEGPCPTEHLPWVMKDPNHCAYLIEILNEFPDAKFVFIHRPPKEVVPSFAKLLVVLTSVGHIPGSPGTTAKEWGRELTLRIQRYVDGLVNFTKSRQALALTAGNDPYVFQDARMDGTTKEGHCRLDFAFENVVKDMPGTIKTIYAKLFPNQPPPSKEAMATFRAFLKANDRKRLGTQERSLEDFHLTNEDVAYKEYHDIIFPALSHPN